MVLVFDKCGVRIRACESEIRWNLDLNFVKIFGRGKDVAIAGDDDDDDYAKLSGGDAGVAAAER